MSVRAVLFSLAFMLCAVAEPYALTKKEKTTAECAKDAVLRKLKSPSTAEFDDSYTKVAVFDAKKGVYTVFLVVDAQNSYGAKLRQGFLVSIKPDFEKSGTFKVFYRSNPLIMKSSIPTTQEELLLFLSAAAG